MCVTKVRGCTDSCSLRDKKAYDLLQIVCRVNEMGGFARMGSERLSFGLLLLCAQQQAPGGVVTRFIIISTKPAERGVSSFWFLCSG